MRVVMGLSLTAKSAVWALVDTKDGTVLADEVVTLDSANEIARAAARSVQAFALQTTRDIEGVRMTWSDDARAHGIRLRTKLRLFGFDDVETVTQEAAREGRNRTARHIAPHLVLAYGAARADQRGGDHREHRRALVRLVSRVPLPVAAGAAGAAVVAGVGIYAMAGGFTASPPVTEAAAPAPLPPAAAPVPAAPAPAAAPQPAAVAPVPSEVPSASSDTDEVPASAAVAEAPTYPEIPTYVSGPADLDTPGESGITAFGAAPTPTDQTPADPNPSDAGPGLAGLAAAGLTPSDPVTNLVGEPHLTGSQLAAGPVQAVVAPAPAQPVTAPAVASPAPAEANGPLSAFLSALP